MDAQPREGRQRSAWMSGSFAAPRLLSFKADSHGSRRGLLSDPAPQLKECSNDSAHRFSPFLPILEGGVHHGLRRVAEPAWFSFAQIPAPGRPGACPDGHSPIPVPSLAATSPHHGRAPTATAQSGCNKGPTAAGPTGHARRETDPERGRRCETIASKRSHCLATRRNFPRGDLPRPVSWARRSVSDKARRRAASSDRTWRAERKTGPVPSLRVWRQGRAQRRGYDRPATLHTGLSLVGWISPASWSPSRRAVKRTLERLMQRTGAGAQLERRITTASP